MGPLCETLWSQGDANGAPCYNYYTPSNNVCGCVATTFAQIMRRFKYPTAKVELNGVYSSGFTWVDPDPDSSATDSMTWHIGGEYGDTWEFGGPAFGGTYDWDNTVTRSSDVTTEAQRQAIGLLMRDCGITVNMSYHGSGSSNTRHIGPALDGETDSDYPGVITIVYNIYTPDMDYPADCSVVSCTVYCEDGETPVASALVTAGDSVSGAERSARTDENGAFTLYLPIGFDYTVVAEKDGVTAGKKLGVVKCSNDMVGNIRDV